MVTRRSEVRRGLRRRGRGCAGADSQLGAVHRFGRAKVSGNVSDAEGCAGARSLYVTMNPAAQSPRHGPRSPIFFELLAEESMESGEL